MTSARSAGPPRAPQSEDGYPCQRWGPLKPASRFTGFVFIHSAGWGGLRWPAFQASDTMKDDIISHPIFSTSIGLTHRLPPRGGPHRLLHQMHVAAFWDCMVLAVKQESSRGEPAEHQPSDFLYFSLYRFQLWLRPQSFLHILQLRDAGREASSSLACRLVAI